MTPRSVRRSFRRWTEGIEGVTGAAQLAASTTEDGRGKAVVTHIVDALSSLAGKWMDYEEDRTHNR